jgi:hypothetical protein
MAWCCQCIDLFFKIVLNKKTSAYYLIYMSGIIGLPLLPTIYMSVKKYAGYGGNIPWCFTRNDSQIVFNFDIVLFYMPILIITGIGIAFMIPVIVTIAKSARRIEGITAYLLTPNTYCVRNICFLRINFS